MKTLKNIYIYIYIYIYIFLNYIKNKNKYFKATSFKNIYIYNLSYLIIIISTSIKTINFINIYSLNCIIYHFIIMIYNTM